MRRNKALGLVVLTLLAWAGVSLALDVPAEKTGKQGERRILRPFHIDGKWGLIDGQGQVVLPPTYDRLDEPSESLILTMQNSKFGYLNLEFQWAIPPTFLSGRSFNGGVATVRESGGAWGLIDRDGKWQLKPVYRFLGKPTHNLIRIKAESSYGYINARGEVKIQPLFALAGPFVDDMAFVADQTEKIGFINRQGELVIPYQFEDVRDFSEGVAAVELDSRWGYVLPSGEYLIEPTFYDADSFHNGHAFVMAPGLPDFQAGQPRGSAGGTSGVSGLWRGFIDWQGRPVKTLALKETSCFSEGLLCAQDLSTELWGYLDQELNWAIAPRFYFVGPFKDGLADVYETEVDAEHNSIGYIDKTGAWVFPPPRWWESHTEGVGPSADLASDRH